MTIEEQAAQQLTNEFNEQKINAMKQLLRQRANLTQTLAKVNEDISRVERALHPKDLLEFIPQPVSHQTGWIEPTPKRLF